jgi:hypothetical protein
MRVNNFIKHATLLFLTSGVAAGQDSVSSMFQKANSSIASAPSTIEDRYKNNPYAKLNWVVPDTNFFGNNRRVYTLQEVKNAWGQTHIMRALEEETLGFTTAVPENIEEKLVLCEYPKLEMRFKEGKLLFTNFSDEPSAVTKVWLELLNYLKDVGIATHDDFWVEDFEISPLFFTMNYKTFRQAVDLMNLTPAEKLEQKNKLKRA